MVWVGRDLKDHLVPTPLPYKCKRPYPTGIAVMDALDPFTRLVVVWDVKA